MSGTGTGSKGCMVEGSSTEEAIKFCTYYLGLNRIGVPMSQHEGRLQGRGTIRERSVCVEVDAFWQAHFAVLRQASIVSPYIEEHKAKLRAANSGKSDTWLAKQHRENFGQWLKEKFLA
jgi:hypothetical protein